MINQEKMLEALALIAQGVTQPTKISAALGMGYRNYRNWLVRSNRGDPEFILEVDGETAQFAKHVVLATKLALFELRGMVTQKSIFGTSEPAMKDGQYVWALDPAAVPLSREDRELLGYHPEALLLDSEGRAQPVMIHTDAPIALQLRLLESAFADLRPTQTINSNLNMRGQVGIAFAKPVNYANGPPMVSRPPDVPLLEAEFSEIDPELEEMLGPEPEPEPAPVINKPLPPREPVIRDVPSERETSPPQPPNSILGPGPKNIPTGWREEWNKLQARAALPDKLNRG